MKHRYFKSLLAILFLMVGAKAFAYDAEIDGIYYYFYDTEATVTYRDNSSTYSGNVVIPATVTYNGETYTVTSIGSSAFLGCSGLTSITIPEGVRIIGGGAFYGCSGLTSITIPESVTSIDVMAFSDCSGLTSINIPDGVTWIGMNTFSGCSGLTSITIPESVTSIGYSAFKDCSGLTSITIPESVTRIEERAFENCSDLTKVEFSSIESLCKISFKDYYSNPLINAHHLYINGQEITDLVIPESVTSIGGFAFCGCRALTSVTIPKSVTSIGESAFRGCENLKIIRCNCPTPPAAVSSSFPVCLALVPEESVAAYRVAEGWNTLFVNQPSFSIHTTQTTITLMSDIFDNVTVVLNGNTYSLTNGTVTINGLSPGKTYQIETSGTYGDITLQGPLTVNTKGIYVSFEVVKTTNVTATLKGSYIAGDAEIQSSGFEGYGAGDDITIDGLQPGKEYYFNYNVICADGSKFVCTKRVETVAINVYASAQPSVTACQLRGFSRGVIDAVITEHGFIDYPMQDDVYVTGLNPNTKYTATYMIRVEGYGTMSRKIQFTTDTLSIKTLSPKVISVGNVIVAADTNVDDEETNVGFEWRRTDWTDDFQSNTGVAYIYEGTIEGYIRNLNAEKLWKVRPYYLSNSGTYYYGDWVGLDPSNTSYFEPTVHTYSKIQIQGNTALVKGYALRGTDNVAVQGFKYWKAVAGAKAANYAPNRIAVPNDAKTVEATGQVMTANLKDLDYDTEYCYVAFVTTSEGETFYGEQQTFVTEADLTPVEELKAENAPACIIARYDVQGRRLNKPIRGINIILMSDGTKRKVIMK